VWVGSEILAPSTTNELDSEDVIIVSVFMAVETYEQFSVDVGHGPWSQDGVRDGCQKMPLFVGANGVCEPLSLEKEATSRE